MVELKIAGREVRLSPRTQTMILLLLDDQLLLDEVQIGRWSVNLAGHKLHSEVTFSRKGREISPPGVEVHRGNQ